MAVDGLRALRDERDRRGRRERDVAAVARPGGVRGDDAVVVGRRLGQARDDARDAERARPRARARRGARRAVRGGRPVLEAVARRAPFRVDRRGQRSPRTGPAPWRRSGLDHGRWSVAEGLVGAVARPRCVAGDEPEVVDGALREAAQAGGDGDRAAAGGQRLRRRLRAVARRAGPVLEVPGRLRDRWG